MSSGALAFQRGCRRGMVCEASVVDCCLPQSTRHCKARRWQMVYRQIVPNNIRTAGYHHRARTDWMTELGELCRVIPNTELANVQNFYYWSHGTWFWSSPPDRGQDCRWLIQPRFPTLLVYEALPRHCFPTAHLPRQCSGELYTYVRQRKQLQTILRIRMCIMRCGWRTGRVLQLSVRLWSTLTSLSIDRSWQVEWANLVVGYLERNLHCVPSATITSISDSRIDRETFHTRSQNHNHQQRCN